jgi:hypothetical protein
MIYDQASPPAEKSLSRLAVVLNIAILVGIVGIIVYWVRRFAVFRGYRDIHADVEKLAEFLKAEAVREGNDVVLAGYSGPFPTIIRFSHRLDTPGLYIQMRVPAAFSFAIMPKSMGMREAGYLPVRTGNAALDKKFNVSTDQLTDLRMFAGNATVMAALEQLCCSTQAGVSLRAGTLELSELTVPQFTANHVFDHVQAMRVLANRLLEMPGAANIKIERLPRRGSSWTIRFALGAALVCLLALLLAQPYNRPVRGGGLKDVASESGVAPNDAARIQRLRGWHVARPQDFSDSAAQWMREKQVPVSGRVAADFAGRSEASDSAYLLLDGSGQRRVSMLARGAVAYDAIFPQLDFLARIPKESVANIKWETAPKFGPDGDALLVVQNADNPSASLVLLRHGTQTYSGRPADFTEIDFGPP